MVSVHVKIHTQATIADYKALRRAIKKASRRALYDVLDELDREAGSRVPIGLGPNKTGLKNSSNIEYHSDTEGSLGYTKRYAEWVHNGTGLWDPKGGHRILPKKAKALRFFSYKLNRWFIVKSTRGQPPQPWLKQSVHSILPNVPKIVGKAFEEVFEEAL